MMESFWSMMTAIGSPTTFFIIAVLAFVAFLLGKNMDKKIARFLLLFSLSVFAAGTATEILKNIFQIERPCLPCITGIVQASCNPHCPLDYGFPSGHASVSFAAVMTIFMACKRKRCLILFTIPLLISASRIFLKVHTVEDAVGGSLIGIFIPLVLYKFPHSSGLTPKSTGRTSSEKSKEFRSFAEKLDNKIS